MNAVVLLVIIALLALGVYYIFINVPEKTTQETEVIEAANEEEAAEKYLEEQLNNVSITDEELEQLLLTAQS